MFPVSVLMMEHRLIERMVWLLSSELERIRGTGIPDPEFLFVAIDFMSNYVDRCHHGKEERILFGHLTAKPLSADHRQIMRELVGEHAAGREAAATLAETRSRFCGGDYGAITGITGALETLIELYPRHIAKEDNQFFLPSMEYFTEEEKSAMLKEFDVFDKNLFKERYAQLVGRHEVPVK